MHGIAGGGDFRSKLIEVSQGRCSKLLRSEKSQRFLVGDNDVGSGDDFQSSDLATG